EGLPGSWQRAALQSRGEGHGKRLVQEEGYVVAEVLDDLPPDVAAGVVGDQLSARGGAHRKRIRFEGGPESDGTGWQGGGIGLEADAPGRAHQYLAELADLDRILRQRRQLWPLLCQQIGNGASAAGHDALLVVTTLFQQQRVELSKTRDVGNRHEVRAPRVA